MKKFVYICIGLLLIYIVSLERTDYAFKESIEGAHIYELVLTEQQVSTRNFEIYFSNYQVISIFPKISAIYQNQFPFSKYSFDIYRTIEQNILQFQNKYINTLEDLGYRKEALKIMASGIPINKVVIYSDEEGISKLKNHFIILEYRLLDR